MVLKPRLGLSSSNWALLTQPYNIQGYREKKDVLKKTWYKTSGKKRGENKRFEKQKQVRRSKLRLEKKPN